MFSRAVDPKADAGRIAAVLTRTTLAVALVTAVPAFIFGPAARPGRLRRRVRRRRRRPPADPARASSPTASSPSCRATSSAGAGPGPGRSSWSPGWSSTSPCNLILIPRYGINGAAASSSISYVLTAVLTLVVFRRLSGRGWVETLVIRRTRPRGAAAARAAAVVGRLRGRRTGPLVGPARRRRGGRARHRRARAGRGALTGGHPRRRRRRQPAPVAGRAGSTRSTPRSTASRRSSLDLPGGGRSPSDRPSCVPLRAATEPPATPAARPADQGRRDGAVRRDRRLPAPPAGDAPGATRPILRRVIRDGRSRLDQGPGLERAARRDARGPAGVPRFGYVAGSAAEVVAGQDRGGIGRLGAADRRARLRRAGRLALGRRRSGRRRPAARRRRGSSRAWSSRTRSATDGRTEPWPRDAGRLRLAWAGRLVEGKGLEGLLAAVALLAATPPDAAATRPSVGSAMGSATARPGASLAAQAAGLGVADRVDWRGFVADRAAYLDGPRGARTCSSSRPPPRASPRSSSTRWPSASRSSHDRSGRWRSSAAGSRRPDPGRRRRDRRRRRPLAAAARPGDAASADAGRASRPPTRARPRPPDSSSAGRRAGRSCPGIERIETVVAVPRPSPGFHCRRDAERVRSAGAPRDHPLGRRRALAWVYLGYPVVVAILARIRPVVLQAPSRATDPHVAIAVHDEAEHIADRIDDAFAQAGAGARLVEVLIGSDGSTDATEPIVGALAATRPADPPAGAAAGRTDGDPGRPVRGGPRRGRRPDRRRDPLRARAAWPRSPRPCATRASGCATGRLEWRDEGATATSSHEGLYWRYERRVRELESRAGC